MKLWFIDLTVYLLPVAVSNLQIFHDRPFFGDALICDQGTHAAKI